MKKIFLAAAFVLSSVVVCNAQWFIGGSVGYTKSAQEQKVLQGTEWGKSNVTNKIAGIDPKIGYMFTDKFGAGIALKYTYNKVSQINLSNQEAAEKMNFYGFSPFVRMVCWQKGRLSVTLEAMVGAAFGKGKSEDDAYPDNIDIKGRVWHAGVTPLVQFNLSKKITLESKLNFLSLNYNYQKREYEIAGTAYLKQKVDTFNFGAESGDIFNTGDLTVGFIYKF